MATKKLVERLQETLADFEARTTDAGELERLRSFYERMKRDGIASTREYDLPQLDTIGRLAFRQDDES